MDEAVLIAFLGDVHGCVLHAMAALLALQHAEERQLDAVVQVGDFSAFPNPDRLQPVDCEYITLSPAQGDVFRLLDPPPPLAAALERFRHRLARPVIVVSGNHEDHDWLAARHQEAGDAFVAIDACGIFEHVADGTIVRLGDCAIAVLGGIDAPGERCDFDQAALHTLGSVPPGAVDVLVTHDGPYGMSTNWNGTVQGSHTITRLIEHLQPRLHVSGHYHHMNGPRLYGPTESYALANLVPPKRRRHGADPLNPEQRVAPGSVGVLDTATWKFRYVTEAWLDKIQGDDVDLDAALDR